MRRTTAALLASLLALLSLPTGAAAKAKVVVTGQVRYADGTPAARTHVELTRVTGLGDVLGSLFLFTFSAGFAAIGCFQEGSDALVLCSRGTAATLTDAHGRYRFELSADAIDRPDRSFTVVARLPRSARRAPGARVELHTHLRVGTNTLPPLPFWEPTFSGPLSELSWTALPGERAPKYVVHYVASSGGLRLDESAAPGQGVDPQLLEDTHGTLQLEAKGHLGQLGVLWTSPVRSYRGTAGAPVSRHAPCTVTVELVAGQRVLRPCWLTDAAYTTPFRGPRPHHCAIDPAFADPMFGQDPTCEFASVTRVELDLGRVVPVAAVLARGECDECQLVGSADHVHWGEPHNVAASDGAVDWGGEQARWIRVLPPSTSFGGRLGYDTPHAKLGGRKLPVAAPGDASRLTELSVWTAAPPQPVGAPEPSGGTASAGGRPAAADRSGTHWPTVVAAALLLLVTAGAAGYALGQRRRTGG